MESPKEEKEICEMNIERDTCDLEKDQFNIDSLISRIKLILIKLVIVIGIVTDIVIGIVTNILQIVY